MHFHFLTFGPQLIASRFSFPLFSNQQQAFDSEDEAMYGHLFANREKKSKGDAAAKRAKTAGNTDLLDEVSQLQLRTP